MTAQNVPASVHQRLLNKARETDKPLNELLQYFAMERFLYRLSNSPHSEKFILKGALMLTVWKAPFTRPTMDIDMLGETENSVEEVVSLVQEICKHKVVPDRIVFDPGSVYGERIREDADYEGVRVRFRGLLGNARITMQLDVGFEDVVVPSAQMTEYPTILEFPSPLVRGYSRESVTAEKFEATVKLGLLNSHMRDFYDIWLLSRQFDFEGTLLAEATRSTFAARKTDISANPTAFSEEFANDQTKSTQWLAFLRKNRITEAPENLAELVVVVADFLVPAAESIVKDLQFDSIWKAPGPWQRRS